MRKADTQVAAVRHSVLNPSARIKVLDRLFLRRDLPDRPMSNASIEACRRQEHHLRDNIASIWEHGQTQHIDIRQLKSNRYINKDKRKVDLLFATTILLVTLPAWLLIALLIKLDSPGPVFFRQARTGYLGRRFEMLKFRTMSADAEQRKAELLHLNLHGSESPDFKLIDDPRVTRLGRLLRRTSLDELPNLINVIKGEMSLVGPRPTSFHASTYNNPVHLPRLCIKPGITGLWQISGRAVVGFDERALLDAEYINRASFLTDFRIILATITKLNHGAY